MIGTLTRIATASLTVCYIPNFWKGSNVVFIAKSGSASYTPSRDFRPNKPHIFHFEDVEQTCGWKHTSKETSKQKSTCLSEGTIH